MSSNIEELQSLIVDRSKPLDLRYRAMYDLMKTGDEKAIATLATAANDPSDLFAHEAAYCIGQLGNEKAIPLLIQILNDKTRSTIVRHEAGEALGAIGKNSDEVLSALRTYENDEAEPLAETCQLALDRITWLAKNNVTNADVLKGQKYDAIEPAISFDYVGKLKEILLDHNAKLSDRYGAMIALRNNGCDDAVEALCEGLEKSKSALQRHQIAFTLGEMEHPKAVNALLSRAKDVKEHQIVRHESIHALGCMGKCLDDIKQLENDPDPVVAETVKIAMASAEDEKARLHH